MGTGERPTTEHRSPTRALIIAWADAHSLDVSNTEADDLVRRLWHPPTPFDTETVEKCVVDALLLLAEGEEHDESTAESLRGLASQVSASMLALRRAPDGEQEPDSSGGVAKQEEVENDDDAPGDAVGEGEGQPLRYDEIYCAAIRVTLRGEGAKAIWPPSFGRVKLKPDGSRRSVVVALDDLDCRSRLALRSVPTRRRTEAVVRCSVRNCPKCHRAWIRHDTRIEDTEGRPINGFNALFAALCEEHRGPL